jgi:hypothetical protein
MRHIRTVFLLIAPLLLTMWMSACGNSVDPIPTSTPPSTQLESTTGATSIPTIAPTPTSNPPTATASADRLDLRSTGETKAPVSNESGGVRVTVTRMAVADY